MAGYSVRTLAELSDQAKGFLTQSISGTVTRVWANTYRVFGKVLALVGQELELRRAWLVRQLFASTADVVWLRRHAFEYGLTQEPASPALGTITVAAPPGLAVPAGLQYARDDGTTFTSVSAATAVGNSVTLTVEADEAAAAGNTDAGTVLTLVDTGDAPTGLDTIGIVGSAGLGGGADQEQLERFRGRVLARKRQPPQGGSAPDYGTWSREALSTVAGVFVDSFQNDARSVWVCFTVTDQPNGIPSDAQVAIVQAYIDDPVRRPVTGRAFAVAPTPVPVPLTIGALAPDTPAIREAIADEVAAVFADRAEPGRPSVPFALSGSWIDEAVSRATGEDSHDLLSPDPRAALVFTAGLLPVPGLINYTD